MQENSRGCSIYINTAVLVLSIDNLHLLDCSVTWSLLTLTDVDWFCWLTADARVQKHKHKIETDSDWPHSTQIVHCLQTIHCWLHLMCERWQNSCILSTRLMTAQSTRNASLEISRNRRPIRTALTFWCRQRRLYLSQTQNYQGMHISFEYALKMGAEGISCSS